MIISTRSLVLYASALSSFFQSFYFALNFFQRPQTFSLSLAMFIVSKKGEERKGEERRERFLYGGCNAILQREKRN
jgi:hypothetical protein